MAMVNKLNEEMLMELDQLTKLKYELMATHNKLLKGHYDFAAGYLHTIIVGISDNINFFEQMLVENPCKDETNRVE